VYKKDCAKCHGKTAEGRHFGGPSLISEKAAAASADDLRNIITNGKGHMPKFAGKLTSEEIDTLVKQIQALNKSHNSMPLVGWLTLLRFAFLHSCKMRVASLVV
jgi:mono/diheme cytochrome c family protein